MSTAPGQPGSRRIARAAATSSLEQATPGPPFPSTRRRSRSAARAFAFDPRSSLACEAPQAFIQARVGEFERTLDQALDGRDALDRDVGSPPPPRGRMVKGSRAIFPQQPSMFYYPYLAQRQFFEREEFDWVPAFEAATPDDPARARRSPRGTRPSRPYVEDEPDRPRAISTISTTTRLDGALFVEGRHAGSGNRRALPQDHAALEQVPLSDIGKRTPVGLLLPAGTRRAHPAAHGDAQQPAHLPSAADRSAPAAGCGSATKRANGKRASC